MFIAVFVGTLGVQVLLIQVSPINLGFGCTALEGWQVRLDSPLSLFPSPDCMESSVSECQSILQPADLFSFQWGLCAGLGFLSIPLNFLFHYIPYEWIPLGSWAGGLNSEEIDEELEKEKEAAQPPSTVSN
eukprot:767064-Hanusia_phi.AAC.3